MKLTGDEAREVVWCDSEDWEQIESRLISTSRWSSYHQGIFKHASTGKHYKFEWSRGLTEHQDEKPFQYEKEVTPVEVRKVTKTVEVWEEINA